MACPETTSVLSLEFQPCIHFKEGKKLITSVKDSTTFTHLFESYHDCQNNSKEPEFTVSAQNQTSIHGSLSVGEVVRNFSLRSILAEPTNLRVTPLPSRDTFLFICKATDDPELNKLQQYAANATKKAVNAFELLMAGGRSFPDKKRSSSGVKGGLSRKDELYNNLIETFFKQHKLDLPKPVLPTEGSYIVQVCVPRKLILKIIMLIKFILMQV
ncbi:uncharacterized protein [Magallana gigas]|uniref:uncharacterized protein n=1 Tax=Magallana gigas TaxID=29159 RepID=UPI00333F0DB5